MLRKKIFFLLCIISVFSLKAYNYTDWTEYPGDPVYAPYPVASLPDDYFPCVIFNQNKFDGNGAAYLYKMWHQGPTGIALSYSNDGINWQLVGQVVIDPSIAPSIPLHASVVYDKNGFGGGPYYYKMWYWTNDIAFSPPFLGIKFTQSIDGITWTTPAATTQDATCFLCDITQGGVSPFYEFYGFGQVLYNPSATSTPGQPFTYPYVTFFDSSAAEDPPQKTEEAVGLAYSQDGIHWFRYGAEPVLLPVGNNAVWDGTYAYRASVIKINDTYHMFYSGANDFDNPDYANFAYAFGIGHASSQDGITWTTDPNNPIFTVLDSGEAWRSGRTLAPTVVISGPPTIDCSCTQLYPLQMWFSGGTNSLTHLTPNPHAHSGGVENANGFASAAIGYATIIAPGATFPKVCERMWLKGKKVCKVTQ